MAASPSSFTTIKTVYGEDIRRFTVSAEQAARSGCFVTIGQTINDTYALRSVPFTITYTDDEGDPCSIGGDEEMREAIRFANAHANKVLKLNVVKVATTTTATPVPLAVAAQVPPTPTAAATPKTVIADAVPVVTATAATPSTPVVEEKKSVVIVTPPSVKFVRDVTMEDESICASSSTMTKTWCVLNDGKTSWPSDVHLVQVSGGEAFGIEKGKTWPVPSTPSGENVNISIEVNVPATVGKHKALFELRHGSTDGKTLSSFQGDNQLTIEITSRSNRNVEFVSDVTIPDGTRVPCYSSHRKVWRIKNNGLAKWPSGSLLIHNDGLVVSSSLFPLESKGIPIPSAEIGETVEIAAHITAPSRSGRNHGEWHMITMNGEKYDGDYALWTQLNVEIPALTAMDVISRLPTWLETPEIVAAIDKLRAKKNYRSSMSQPTEVIHAGITCDGCGMYPIRGIRFKCTKCPDFDLCSTCESKQVNVGNHKSDHVFIQAKLPLPPLPTSRVVAPVSIKVKAAELKKKLASTTKRGAKVPYRADFVEDITLTDGSVVMMNSVVTKRWSVKNTGTETWPVGTQLVYVGGDIKPASSTTSSGSPLVMDVVPPRALAGQIVEVSARVQVPNKSGRYTGFYQLATVDGIRFGHRFWLDVMSAASTATSTTTTTTPSTPVSVTTVTPLRVVPTSTASPTVTPTVASAVVTAVTTETKKTVVAAKPVTPATTVTAVTTTPIPTPTKATSSRYATQLASLKAMGFKDDEMLLDLLAAANGNERTVLDWLVNPVV